MQDSREALERGLISTLRRLVAELPSFDGDLWPSDRKGLQAGGDRKSLLDRQESLLPRAAHLHLAL